MSWSPGAIADAQLPLYKPSGDTSGATDTALINALILAHGGVELAPVLPGGNPYWINSPILLTEDSMTIRGVNGYPFTNNPPFRSGSVVLAANGFAGTAMIVAKDPAGNSALDGCQIEGIVLAGRNLAPVGIYTLLLKSLISKCVVASVTGDGIVLDQLNPAFPKASYDNRVLDSEVTIVGGNGINVLGATDSMIYGNRINQTTGHGIFVQAAGGQYIGNHIYTTAYPTGYAIRTTVAQDVLIQGNRCHSYQGGIWVAGASGESGFAVMGNSLQASTHVGDDNTLDAITVTAVATLVGGVVGPNFFRNATNVAIRWRYGVNIAAAFVTSCAVGAIVDSHDGSVASAFGTAALNNLGTTTRNFNALA